MERWKDGKIVRQKDRKMERWKDGNIKRSKDEKMKRCKNGKMERSKVGKIDRWKDRKTKSYSMRIKHKVPNEKVRESFVSQQDKYRNVR